MKDEPPIRCRREPRNVALDATEGKKPLREERVSLVARPLTRLRHPLPARRGERGHKSRAAQDSMVLLPAQSRAARDSMVLLLAQSRAARDSMVLLPAHGEKGPKADEGPRHVRKSHISAVV